MYEPDGQRSIIPMIARADVAVVDALHHLRDPLEPADAERGVHAEVAVALHDEARALEDGLAVPASSEPSTIRIRSVVGRVSAVSVPSKPTRACVPSQNGFELDCPQRHRA